MVTKKGTLPDGEIHKVSDLVQLTGVRFKELHIVASTTNEGLIYLGDATQQSIELIANTIGFNFENTPIEAIYVHGTTGDIFTVVGLE